MSNLPEVPTDELLSFQDYPTVHNSANDLTASAQLNLDMSPTHNDFDDFNKKREIRAPLDDIDASASKSFWTIEYYQQFFDVDTKDVIERILASITPRRDNSLKNHLRNKPDLYGPFWISLTLIFTIAISGNVAHYLQHANEAYHWKYDFHLVSYAATAIFLYITIVPLALWALLKWSSDVNSLDGLEDGTTPGSLELICIYGYSIFIYIPASILWTIQYTYLQWLLLVVAAFLSGSVLLFTLMPALRLSRYKLYLTVAIIVCHLLLAVGFMRFFFHNPGNTSIVPHHEIMTTISTNKSSPAVPALKSA